MYTVYTYFHQSSAWNLRSTVSSPNNLGIIYIYILDGWCAQVIFKFKIREYT